jgi:hypothetical protein
MRNGFVMTANAGELDSGLVRILMLCTGFRHDRRFMRAGALTRV